MAVRILQEDGYGNRVVELSSSMETWCSSSPVFQQVVAVLERDGEVSIHKIEPGSETLSVRLTPQEVERFFEAYQAYNREQAGPEQPQEDEFYSLDDHPF